MSDGEPVVIATGEKTQLVVRRGHWSFEDGDRPDCIDVRHRILRQGQGWTDGKGIGIPIAHAKNVAASIAGLAGATLTRGRFVYLYVSRGGVVEEIRQSDDLPDADTLKDWGEVFSYDTARGAWEQVWDWEAAAARDLERS